jgi:spermidine synthase
MGERRALWPMATELAAEHVRNCRVYPNRVAPLELVPQDAICAEVGIFECDFSAEIRKRAPKELHLIDIDPQWLDGARRRFPGDIASGRIVLHEGDSSTVLRSLPPASFDWIYIDGDHHYDGCKKDIEAAAECLKPGGLMALNDYTFWGASDFYKYGVMEAVNEFCATEGWEFVYFALQGRGYHDVAIRKMN